MAQPWEAERPVDAALARRLVDAAWPDLACQELTPLGAGWDNTVYRLGDERLVRFPRRELAVRLLRHEERLLPLIAPHLDVRISSPERVARPDAAYAWPFACYRYLPGTTLCRASIDAPAQRRLARDLGAALARLHALPTAPFLERGAPLDELRRVDPAHRAPAIPRYLERFAPEDLPRDVARLHAIAEAALACTPRSGAAVVHGDLYARHLLVDGAGALCGIIDWGDVHLGDPAVDIGGALLVLDPEDLPAFVAAYGTIDDRTMRLARLRALHHACIEVDYGHAVGDAPMLAAGRAGLRRLAAA